MKVILFLCSILVLTSFAAAGFGYTNEEGPVLIPEVNLSLLDVNNSQYFQGYTPTTLRTWMQSFFDTIYCKLTGCTMAGDINMNTNNILSVGEIQTERIVTTLNTTNGFCTNSSGDTFFGYIEGAC